MKQTNYLEDAISLYKKKDYSNASTKFKILLEIGNHYEYLMSNLYLGKMLLRDEDTTIDDVSAYFLPILKEGSTYQKEQVYFELANKCRMSGDIMKSIILYETCLFLVPRDTYVLTDLANLYLCQNDLEKAKMYYEDLIVIAATQNVSKKQLTLNTAYIGLARIAIKEENISTASKYLEQVKPITRSDYEQMKMVYTSIYFMNGLFDKALNSLDINVHSRLSFIKNRAISKSGIIYALKDQDNLAFRYLEKSTNPYDNIALGALYFSRKNYEKACESYLNASRLDKNYLVKALECAMYFDEVLAIKIANNLLRTEVPKDKYINIILYLSKKNNIFFSKAIYTNLDPKDQALLNPSLEAALSAFQKENKLNANLYYASSFLKSTIIQSLEDSNSIIIKGPVTDKYFVNIPFIGWNGEDYLVIETLKETKEVVHIDLATTQEVRANKTSNVLKRDKNIKKLFK